VPAAGIREGERSGRPPRITHEARLRLIALACEAQEPEGRVTPTLDEIAARAVERGVVEQIRRSHVQRILQAGDVRPHRVQQWLHSPDPAFREKVNVICKLYRKAPRKAVVLSIDEKTGIQAIERKHPGRAPAPGRLRQREFEYIRHGTQALIAALDVHSGKVLAECRERRTQNDLVAFLERVAAAYPGNGNGNGKYDANVARVSVGFGRQATFYVVRPPCDVSFGIGSADEPPARISTSFARFLTSL
jgi:hypothetical protein